jgi:hypothetical protein
MASKKTVRCVVVALTFAFMMSAFVVMISPVAKASLWTQTTDLDFGAAQTTSNVNIQGTGASAYVQLNKTFFGWFNKNPVVAPSKRQAAASFFDTVNGRTMVMGGIDALSVNLNDTWAYYAATNTWSKLSDQAPWSARWSATAAFDSIHGIGVLFGGWDANGQNYETWEYAAATGTWTNRTGAAKPSLTSTPLAFDSAQQRIIASGMGRFVWETWAYDVTTHIWTARAGTNPPSDRASHSLVYYPLISRTVLYGGASGMSILDQTWEYNYLSDSWTDKTSQIGGGSPGGRSGFGFVYRATQNDLMLFGGLDPSGYPATTYRYWDDLGSRYWAMISTGSSPPGRVNLVMSYDTGTTSSVVFSGKDQPGNKLNDTWQFDNAYQPQGTLQSSKFNSLHSNTVWKKIFWNQTPGNVPAGGTIRFQIATCSSPDFTLPGCEFKGPDGSPSSYYVNPGTVIYALASPAQYMVYFVQILCSSCTDSPHLEDVSIEHTAASIPPTVANTYPWAQTGVPVNSQIWLNFSEPMDTGQVTVTLKDTGTWTNFPFSSVWQNSSVNLIMTHSGNPFEICTQYRYNITQAIDQEGQSMVGLPKTYVFSTYCPLPEIAQVYPHLSDVDIPLASAIYVNFSNSMNIGSVDVNVTPPLPDSNYQWSNGNKNVKVSHVADLDDCVLYTVNVTGMDIYAQGLLPGSVPNPWYFESHCKNPRVISTSPNGGSIEVAVDKSVTITFSHKMKPSTVNVAFTPTISLTPSWNAPANTTLTLSHPPAFTACTKYTINVTGQDTSGNNIQGGYYSFWIFTTCGGSPFVLQTMPIDQSIDVPLDYDVQIIFNEAMQRPTVEIALTVVPNDWTWTVEWVAMDAIIILNHTTDFSTCKTYFINVTGGRDVDENKPLVNGPVPRNFRFDTLCTSPSVKTWVPPDNSVDVARNQNIVITFNKPMNIGTFQYTIDPPITLGEAWTNGYTVFTLSHGPLFANCTDYSLRIGIAESQDGFALIGDRELNFRTFCPGPNPFIVITDPADGATGVALDKLVFVQFNKTMDRASLSVQVTPNFPMAPIWGALDMYLNLSHAPFAEDTTYTITIHACDLFAQCLVPGPVPNPWSFTTTSTNPKIMLTDPANNAVDVPLVKTIVVDFNKPMNTGSVNAIVNPSGITFSNSWSNGDRRLSMVHSVQLQACTLYTITITGQDTVGNSLVPGPVPNPWSFTTTCLPAAPPGLQVARSGNDIVLTWRAATLATGYYVYSATNRFAPLPWAQVGNVTGLIYTATGDNADTINHFYLVRGHNALWLEGPNSSMGARMYRQFSLASGVPNSQWFSLPYRSTYTKASDITTELTDAKINVVAKWDARKQTTILYYWFHNAWRGQDFNVLPGDGLYIGLVASFGWSITGTDSSTALQFTMNPPPKTNYNFISLPYTTSYTNAQSITNELTSSKVVELGHWDAASHAWQKWTLFGGTWTGTNFAIMPGDGFYMVIASTFTWAPKLITPDVP